jgi:hypothetical protein
MEKGGSLKVDFTLWPSEKINLPIPDADGSNLQVKMAK